MLRFLQKKTSSVRKLLLLLGLLTLCHLCKDSLHHRILRADVVMEKRSQVSALTQNTSHVYSWQRCVRNMSVNSATNFHSLPVHIQDFLYYRPCRHFPIILDVPDKCGGADHSSEVFLLLVIKSSPHNYARREVLRKTWANETSHNGVWIRRLFLMGTSGTGLEKKQINKVLRLEQGHHHDILQWDFMDTFFNLTLKQVLFLEWMERNCPKVSFLLNGDDDVFVNSHNIFKYLQSLEDNDGSKHLFTGYLIKFGQPVRKPDCKYFVPVQVYESDVYPPYCSGGGFILSGYTALVIYNMSQSTALIPIDDVYMGMCLAKAGLQPGLHIGVKTVENDVIYQYAVIIGDKSEIPQLNFTMDRDIAGPQKDQQTKSFSANVKVQVTGERLRTGEFTTQVRPLRDLDGDVLSGPITALAVRVTATHSSDFLEVSGYSVGVSIHAEAYPKLFISSVGLN